MNIREFMVIAGLGAAVGIPMTLALNECDFSRVCDKVQSLTSYLTNNQPTVNLPLEDGVNVNYNLRTGETYVWIE